MEDLKLQVLREFEVIPKRIIKEKSYYICKTDKGNRIVKKSFDTKENLEFQNEVKVHLYDNGFRNIDVFSISRNRKPYVEIENNIYVMTEMKEAKESNYSDRDGFLKVVKEVARFHRIGKGINFGGEIFYQCEGIIEKSTRNLQELSAIRKKLKTQRKLLDFDVLFLKNYSYYEEELRETIAILENSEYIEEKSKAKERGQICHNLLKEENVLQIKEGVYISSFSKIEVGSKLQDIAMLIQRHRKSAGEEAMSIQEIVENYSEENEITKEESKILYGILKYPEKYMKIVNQYYSKKRSWIPNAINNRMGVIVDSKGSYEKYIKKFGLEFFVE